MYLKKYFSYVSKRPHSAWEIWDRSINMDKTIPLSVIMLMDRAQSKGVFMSNVNTILMAKTMLKPKEKEKDQNRKQTAYFGSISLLQNSDHTKFSFKNYSPTCNFAPI